LAVIDHDASRAIQHTKHTHVTLGSLAEQALQWMPRQPQ
jgi:hypothetical protein